MPEQPKAAEADPAKAEADVEPDVLVAAAAPGNKASRQQNETSAEGDDESASDGDGDGDGGAEAHGEGADGASKKKKKKNRKRNKVKSMLGIGGAPEGAKAEAQQKSSTATATADAKKTLDSLTEQQIKEFIALNPSLANELGLGQADGGTQAAALTPEQVNKAIEQFKLLKLQDIMTGLASTGKNRKDVGGYKFWATQPVPQFGDDAGGVAAAAASKPAASLKPEGPLETKTVDEIPAEPLPLAIDGFRWVTMDLTDDKEIEEVYRLLNGHYVEDDEALFRFKYSQPFLRWALMSPGWKRDWHVGIRVNDTLCAFISAIPAMIRVRAHEFRGAEVNFLCVHKKLRGKRLAPVLIKEVTRRCNREGVWQAIYTGGIVLPRPVSTCRYFHRAIDWQKLNDIGFCQCPSNSKPRYQVRKYTVPERTSLKGLRCMETRDVPTVHALLTRYLARFDIAPRLTPDEIEHWIVHKGGPPADQVMFSYVVEDPSGKITDMFSFYALDSTVIKSTKHNVLRAAYLFYYATETGIATTTPPDRRALKERLNVLVANLLVLARQSGFDVVNALSLLDNSAFLEEHKFGPGDGQLHYYLFNYRAHPIHGGVHKDNRLDTDNSSGVGFVML